MCVGGGASAAAQHDIGVGQGAAIDDHPGGADATRHDGATPVKVEVGTRPASPDDDAPATAGKDGEALPVPSDADDGETRPGMDDGRPLEEASGADDGLPSFSPDDMAPESPAEPDDGLIVEGTAPPRPTARRPRSTTGCLSSPSLTKVVGLADRTMGPAPPRPAVGAARCARERQDWARRPLESFPTLATTVFGGGIGVALEADSGGNANVAHSVEVSESESDLGTTPPAPTPVAPEATATAAPVGGDTPLGAEGALQ